MISRVQPIFIFSFSFNFSAGSQCGPARRSEGSDLDIQLVLGKERQTTGARAQNHILHLEHFIARIRCMMHLTGERDRHVATVTADSGGRDARGGWGKLP